ncbi:outer membrane biogenesis protein BamB [Polystyrenella longa]|uniref:Outer membrane biogenesis protein BamB n=2 Tax=Polystyrenella longa TaxID=2528007 RepID=A0A518CQY8_9PLAN|nr:outer membrane biogenesis protein BamB [Polystyrenella longa]
MWRYDAGRTGVSPHALPDKLYPGWSVNFGKRKPVWDDPLNHDLMKYDSQFEPVVVNGLMLLSFNDTDKVLALDVKTSEERWRFYADGPIRYPAACADGKAYVVSDDGYLYCLDVNTGNEIWKFRGGPSDRKILGNERLISTWPARGAAVVDDGTVYFAASIWPFMGTFIYALDAETGDTVWVNDNTSALYIDQPHHYPAFAGIAPQGHLAVNDKQLFIPGGRSIPASLERDTGKLQFFHLADYGKSGGSYVFANNSALWAHERDDEYSWFILGSGRRRDELRGHQPVLSDKAFIYSGDSLECHNYDDPKETVWKVEADATKDMIQAGSRLYAAGEKEITVWQLSEDEATAPEKIQTLSLDGTIARLVAADDRLIVTTDEGQVFVFTGNESETATEIATKQEQLPLTEEAKAEAQEIVRQLTPEAAYGYFVGIGDGELLKAVVAESKLKWIVLDSDTEKVTEWRKKFDIVDPSAVPGSHPVAFLDGELNQDYTLPVYLSSMTIINDPAAIGYEATIPGETELAENLFEGLRPYGGKLWFINPDNSSKLLSSLKGQQLQGSLAKGEFTSVGSSLTVTRAGQLPGAGNWTHQYGDIENTVKSDDSRVKLPMGLLWFGGSSNMDVLPRHGHGPPEQIIGGRLYIQGMDVLNARDVYTGQVLWQTKLVDTGAEGLFFDQTYKDTPLSTEYNQVHIPGANARGTNYIATEDLVYILQKDKCRVLDAVTGKDVAMFDLPELKFDEKSEPVQSWGYIGIAGNNLLGGLGFAEYSQRKNLPIDTADQRRSKFRFVDYDQSASRGLTVMDRHSGQVKWQVPAKHSLIHNAICVGRNVVYVLDKLPPNIEQQLARRGEVNPDTYSLTAYDIETGDVVWKTSENIFGTWLGYSDEYRILIQSTRPSNDTVRDENGRQIIAYDADTGDVLWNESISYSTPPILHGDKLITGGRFYSLITGKPLMRTDPLTGKEDVWSYSATKGCNYPIACETMLTFRSSSAAFYDMTNDGGTGHFGGFKSGCTSNLIAADGLLNAPDYTRTCSCSFQNQTSLAMVHMPDLEIWTHNDMAYDGDLVRAVGINFGAPGDRRDEEGTLWLDYPEIGGPSPSLTVSVKGDAEYFLDHSSRYQGEELKWVASSGVKGASQIDLLVKPTAIDQLEFGFPANSSVDDAAELPNGDMIVSNTTFYPASKQDHTAGIRFNSLPLPKGAKIKSAYIQFTATKAIDTETKVTVWSEAVDDVKSFSTKRESITKRPKTEASVKWEIEPWEAARHGEAERTPDLKTLIEEIVNRDGWEPGNAIGFIIKGSGDRAAVAADGDKKGDKSGIPRLFIELEEDSLEQVAEVSHVPSRPYTVRLFFAEPEQDVKVGDRRFNVNLQGEPLLRDFDILAETGGARDVLVKEFNGIPISSRLKVELEETGARKPVLSGIEIKLETE